MLVDYYPGSGIRQNLGRNAALGKKTECGMLMTEVRDAGLRDQELPFPTLYSGVKLSVPPSVLFCHQRHDVIKRCLWYIYSSNLLNPLQMIHYSCVHSILVWHTTPCLTKRRHSSKIPSFPCSLAHQRSCEESVSRVLL